MLLAMVLVGGPVVASAAAQDNASADPVTTESVAEQAGTNDEASEIVDSAEDERREHLATVLLMLLGGVGIVGVALIAATMIWGAKLRRLARVPGSGPTKQDELWYLKSPPPADERLEDDPGGADDPAPAPASDQETKT